MHYSFTTSDGGSGQLDYGLTPGELYAAAAASTDTRPVDVTVQLLDDQGEPVGDPSTTTVA